MEAYPSIEVLEKVVVVPSEKTPTEDIWLSNLDLLALRVHTPTVYFYRRHVDDVGFFSPETLKASLARVLVPFYPLAGRLASGADGRLCIRCTGEGAPFVVARSESTVEDLGDFAPSNDQFRLLVPSVDGVDEADVPLVMFQLTFFQCGGVCLVTAVHHSAVDGLGALYFINSWAKITHTNTHILIPPYLDRTQLRSRSPPIITSASIDSYTQSSHSPSSTNSPFTSALLKLSKRHISLLKASPTNNNAKPPISTFKAVAAHIWRSVCKARKLPQSTLTRIYIIGDARSRLQPPLPASYLGNAVFRTSAKTTVEEVLSELGAVAKIDDAVKALDDEFVRSLVDYLELKVNDARLRMNKYVIPSTDLWVVSWMDMPVYEADFGWGKPYYMGWASMPISGSAYILPSLPEDEEEGVLLLMTMEEGTMKRFKEAFYEEIERGGSDPI